ncbi:MAG: diphosphomevalonate decarboxylase [Thermoplasmata archaeon]|nr:diphosphomevalonate decarboxylase [Thermoplasmata archaeon]
MADATFEAGPNIALVKYWGARDAARVLPNNSSLSVTLDRLRTRTTVRFDPTMRADTFTLDGTIVTGRPLDEVSQFLDRVRALAHNENRASVDSTNNFPTASGLASSASGFAALAGAASTAAGLDLSPRALSSLARQGSGSASRSIFGGFVEWRAGRRADGRDSYSVPLFPEDHWPELVDLVAVVRDAPTKAIRSGVAMQATVATSPGYGQRLAEVPGRLRRMKRAIRDRDPESLFDATIEECDSFRGVCETTVPALNYLTPTSRRLLEAVRAANREAGRTIAAYTHDAGAHVHVFTTRPALPVLNRRMAGVDGVARWITAKPGPGLRSVAGGASTRHRARDGAPV